MSTICLNFQVHQPCRMNSYDFFKIGEHAFYEDDELNAKLLNKITECCYLPANRMMRQMIALYEGKFRFGLAISGIFLEQCFRSRPDVLASFKELVDTGCVELLAMPYYATFSSVYSDADFAAEIEEHRELCKQLFGCTTKVLWNTALAYSDHIAYQAETLGMTGIIADTVDYALEGKSNNEVYQTPGSKKIRTLFRHTNLSTDLSDRRIEENWSSYPLAPATFAHWLSSTGGSVINLDMDYEILGDRQTDASGVFEFWTNLIEETLLQGNTFATASEVIARTTPSGEISIPHVITNGTHHNTHNWLSNVLQNEAITKIYQIEKEVKNCGDPDLLHTWRKLQTADHFFYMSENAGKFSPFDSPYDMYISYMNALADLHVRVGKINNIDY